MAETTLLIGWTTVSNMNEAKTLAEGAIERNLAACVQIDGPINSTYHWEGQAHTSQEFRLTFKFLDQRARELEDWLLDAHPYEIPQWVAVGAERVAYDYLEWAKATAVK